MAREDRPLPPPVAEIEPLLAEGHRYAFFQALRLLRLHLGEETFAQSVRVRPTLSLSFPENDINSIVRENDILRITANFFGLYGVTSPLPTFYTEDLIRSEEHTSELQSLMRTSYPVFCLNNKNSTH